jgi:aspartyl-tRNA(Asn)/glutamyl-tRNA(Gln) amidotransferase subunit A
MEGGRSEAFTGVPITIKDLIYVAGTTATGGAALLKGFVPDVDAAVVTAIKEAGAIVTCEGISPGHRPRDKPIVSTTWWRRTGP